MMSVLLVLAAMAGQPAAGQDRCMALAASIGPDRVCRATPNGIVIAASATRGEVLAAIAAQGEARFRRRLGQVPPAYAVVEMRGTDFDKALDARLATAGYAWRLPWLSEAAMADGYRASITRAVAAKAKAMSLDAAQTAQLVTAALAQQPAIVSTAALREKEESALPHELGHGWFIKAFWPANQPASGDHYGGPAPDWLDETAAVLMEDDRLAERRRTQFAAIYRGTDEAARRRLLDLTTFLSGGHPAPAALPAGLGAGGERVRVLTGAEAAQVAAAASGFYLQSRLFADYVIARSGDDAAFRSAAQAVAAGQTTGQWLAAKGGALHLPTTLPALQRDWQEWLAGRLGAVSP